MAHEEFRRRLSLALKMQLEANDPAINKRTLARINSEYAKYVRGDRGSPEDGSRAKELTDHAKIDWKLLKDASVPIQQVAVNNAFGAAYSSSNKLFKRELVQLEFSPQELMLHFAGRSGKNIKSWDLALSGNLVDRMCVSDAFEALQVGASQGLIPVINLFGPSGHGRKSALSAIQERALQSEDYVVYQGRPEALFDLDLLDEIHQVSEANAESIQPKKILICLDSVDETSVSQNLSLAEMKANIQKFWERYRVNVGIIFASTKPNESQSEHVRCIDCRLALSDEINLFNLLSVVFGNAHLVVPSIEEYWRRTGGQRNHGGSVQAFVDGYAWCAGEHKDILGDIRSAPKKFDQLKYVSACQLLDLPLPEKILSGLLEEGAKTVASLAADYPKLVRTLRIYDDDVEGIKLDTIVAGIEVSRCLGVSSARALLRIFREVSDFCVDSLSSNYDAEVANFYRLLLHRLAKGRGIGSAELNGGFVVSKIVPHFLDETFDLVFKALGTQDLRCEWIGTITSMIRHIRDRQTSRDLKERSLDLLDEVVSSPDLTGISPRAFTSISSSINHILKARPSAGNKMKLCQIADSFVAKIDLRTVVSKDYERNRTWNWRARVNSTYHAYTTLLIVQASLQPKHFDPVTNARFEILERAVGVLDRFQDHLPEGLEMELTSANSLLKAKTLGKIDVDRARVAYREILPVPEADIRDLPEHSITVIMAYIDFNLEHGELEEGELDKVVEELASVAAQAIEFIGQHVVERVVAYVAAWMIERPRSTNEIATLLTPFCYTVSSVENKLIINANMLAILKVVTDEARYPPKRNAKDDTAGLERIEQSERAVRMLFVALDILKYVTSEFELSNRVGTIVERLFWGMGGLDEKYPELEDEKRQVLQKLKINTYTKTEVRS